jgi:LysM repeat protein
VTRSTPFLPRRARSRRGMPGVGALRLAAVPVTAVGVAAGTVPPASAAAAVVTPAASVQARGPAAAATGLTTYLVAAGDTLGGIALRFGTDLATLVRLNRLTDADHLQVGEALIVPAKPTVRPPVPPAPVTTVSYTVKAGDSLWGIAARAGTTVDALTAANHLAPNAVIVPGQVLLVPAARLPRVPQRRPRPPVAPQAVHVVKQGETITSIAAKYHLTVAAVLRANKLAADSIIRPGQKLLLPGVPAKRPERAPAPVTHAYVVRRGDTLSGIAVAARVPLTTVMALNHLSAADVIFPGQRLLLPGPAPATPPRPTRTAAGALAARPLRAPVRQAAEANRAAVAVRPAPDPQEVEGLVRGTARRFGVDPALAVAVAVQESGLDQHRVSSANAVGVMQVVPSSGRWASTLVGRQLNLLDTHDNVVAGVAILSALSADEPEEVAVAAYYQGLGSVRAHGMYADTRRYVADVLALRRRFR